MSTNSRARRSPIPTGLGLGGTKWANYRLRGTQVDFINSIGRPVILSNSQIERGFLRSSCIRCHADATVNKEGRYVVQFEVLLSAAPTPTSSAIRQPANVCCSSISSTRCSACQPMIPEGRVVF